MTNDLHYASLVEIGERIRERSLSSAAVTEAMLSRIDALDGTLCSYLTVTPERALAEAKQADEEIAADRHRGPLHGVPIAVKDLCFTKGVPTTFGMAVYRDFVPGFDATVVARLRQAGAVMLGKLHLHEGAYGEHHPDTKKPLNPWNLDYWPGGSSSGSGVATAAGLCFASLGSDTGGSIRFPCHANAVTGVKPTWGRVSRHGVFPLAESLDTVGPMARSAADAAAVLGAIAGHDPEDPTSLRITVPDYLARCSDIFAARGLRIGFDEAFAGEGTDPQIVKLIADTLDCFSELDAEIRPIGMPDIGAILDGQMAIMRVECAGFHEQPYRTTPQRFGKALGAAVETGLSSDPLAYAAGQIERDKFKGRLARIFREVDAILLPVFPKIGVRYDAYDAFLSDLPDALRFTSPFNMSGSPSVIMPCGFSADGLPIGFQLVGPHLSEATLLAAAHAYQQATDWHLRRPPLDRSRSPGEPA
jgi:amidase